jgi:DNA-binding IclR family transcriptional regulator
MHDEAKHPVSTSKKTIKILDALQELGSAGVTELASAVDMNKSTVHNHLSTLKSEDLVVQKDDEYTLGLRLLEFGGRARDQRSLYDIATPEIERLANQTGELANLVVEEYGHGVYLVCEKGDKAVNLDIYPGVRRLLHVTASGKAILAHLPTERIDEIIEHHGLPAKTEQSITDRDVLLDHLEEVREQGFAVDDEEHINGLRCIGTPILSDEGDVLGAVSISVPVTRMDDDQFYNEVPDIVRSATNVIELHVQNSR